MKILPLFKIIFYCSTKYIFTVTHEIMHTNTHTHTHRIPSYIWQFIQLTALLQIHTVIHEIMHTNTHMHTQTPFEVTSDNSFNSIAPNIHNMPLNTPEVPILPQIQNSFSCKCNEKKACISCLVGPRSSELTAQYIVTGLVVSCRSCLLGKGTFVKLRRVVVVPMSTSITTTLK